MNLEELGLTERTVKGVVPGETRAELRLDSAPDSPVPANDAALAWMSLHVRSSGTGEEAVEVVTVTVRYLKRRELNANQSTAAREWLQGHLLAAVQSTTRLRRGGCKAVSLFDIL